MSVGRWRLSGLVPVVRERAEILLDAADRFGLPVTVTSGYRSLEEQARLRARWEAGKSRWPANRPGDSSHNYGLAFDSVTDPPYQAAWDAFRSWVGFGIPANDEIHAEVPGWRRFLA